MAKLAYIEASRNPGNIPEGLKQTWIGGPDTLNSAAQQVVIAAEDGSEVYIFSYIDNRYSMAFVRYSGNQPGTPVEKTGARYPWAAGLDPEAKTITVSGQSNNLVTVTFDELGIS